VRMAACPPVIWALCVESVDLEFMLKRARFCWHACSSSSTFRLRDPTYLELGQLWIFEKETEATHPGREWCEMLLSLDSAATSVLLALHWMPNSAQDVHEGKSLSHCFISLRPGSRQTGSYGWNEPSACVSSISRMLDAAYGFLGLRTLTPRLRI